jgi:hypothetical protein
MAVSLKGKERARVNKEKFVNFKEETKQAILVARMLKSDLQIANGNWHVCVSLKISARTMYAPSTARFPEILNQCFKAYSTFRQRASELVK